MNKNYVLAYMAGVLTVPVAVVIFRKPISRGVGTLLVDEKFDEPLFRFMTSRTDRQDLRKASKRQKKAGA